MSADSLHTTPDRAPVDHQSIDELDAAICTLARQMNAETYRLLMLVREFDDRFGWAKWGLRNCAEWLAWRCGFTLSTAREKVRTAHALRAMPEISAAFADGQLSYSKVRALTRVAELHDEKSLLAYALRATAPQVEERCREIRNVAPESASGAWRAWERRSLTLWRDQARGMMKISVEVPIEQGEVIAQALERAAEDGDSAIGLEFTAVPKDSPEGVRDCAAIAAPAGSGWRAQQADALVAIAKDYLNAGHAGERSAPAADHYQIVVHTDRSALHGGQGRSDLPIETVKRLTCDGSLITVVEDEDGTPLDVGRKRRTVTTAIRRALWSRDRHCTFPGCHNRCYVDAHHIRHWAEGGETCLENLTLLCSHHHTLLHEGGFMIRRNRDGAIYFQRPDGRVIPRFGYRLEDMRDDYEVAERHADDCGVTSKPSMEVRERAARYRVRYRPRRPVSTAATWSLSSGYTSTHAPSSIRSRTTAG